MSEDANPPFDPAAFTPEAISARLAEERRLRRLQHRPANTLHIRPNLDYYRRQARRLHESQREKDPSSKLHAAQLAVARGVGYASWPRLVAAIRDREHAANELREALLRRDHEAIVRIVRKHPLALLDVGCVAPPDELGLLLEFVPVSEYDSDLRTALLDAVAEHHEPEGLEECVRMLLNWWSVVDSFYANDTIEERRERAAASPKGTRAVEMFDNTLGVLVWYVDEPDYDYMPEDD